jgi:hypothetical protein
MFTKELQALIIFIIPVNESLDEFWMYIH